MTIPETKKLLKERGLKWKDFLKWMNGQTVSMDENGETNFLSDDVWRFIRNEPIID